MYSEVVTAAEVFELATQRGTTDFARLIAACESWGPYCLIGGLAVNCYVEPVYTLDADVVAAAASLGDLTAHLAKQGFRIEQHSHPVNVVASGSELRIRFTTDERYQAFLPRRVEGEILGMRVKVACIEDVARGKLWEYGDPRRRLSKRKKDELDLIRLAERYPDLREFYPREILPQLDG